MIISIKSEVRTGQAQTNPQDKPIAARQAHRSAKGAPPSQPRPSAWVSSAENNAEG